MKNLVISILILLFVASCTTARQEVSSGKIKIGISKNQLKGYLGMTALSEDAFLGGCYRKYHDQINYEVLASSSRSVYFIFSDVTIPSAGCSRSDTGNGSLAKIAYTINEVNNYISSKNKSSQSSTRVAKKSPSKKPATKNRKTGSSGSAFFVTQRGHIITNYHVVKNCSNNPKIKYKNKDIDTKVIAKDQLLDLALLKADLTNTKYVSLSKKQPRKLQRIIASGYPFGKYISDDLKFTSGIVSSLKGPNDDSTLVQVDAALNPGNSGGPIVDEESGQLVAVSVMGMKKNISEGQNFGIKTSSVRNFLDANQIRTPSSFGAFKSVDVAKLLEDSTLYTFCR